MILVDGKKVSIVPSNPRKKKMKFQITLWYFKPSGKFYTEATFNWHGASVGPEGHESCYMADVCAHVHGLRDKGGQGALPGMCGDGWEGPILVNCDKGYPCLILPPEWKEVPTTRHSRKARS